MVRLAVSPSACPGLTPMLITRFAPSPTGPLHLGHAYSALLAHDMARKSGGRFLLRIDDLDHTRARPEWESQIYDDLRWLGLDWPTPCRRESDCFAEYDAALDRLWDLGVLYPCTCTRRDIAEALGAPQEGVVPHGPDGPVYPGTCRQPIWEDARWSDGTFPRPKDVHLRLHMSKALSVLDRAEHAVTGTGISQPISFDETGTGPSGQHGHIGVPSDHLAHAIGDIVVARKDFGASYHLAVVVDDAAQSISHVVRGQDLFEATKIHIVLQDLLGLPRPTYHHHRLIRDDSGKRLAKRDNARAIAAFREAGATPQDIRNRVGLPAVG